MEDLLLMSMDQIQDLLSNQHKKQNPHRIDPYDHYEVEVGRLTTVYTGESLKEAMIVYTQECESRTPRAVIHVKGRSRLVIATNSHMYLKHATEKEIASNAS